MTHRVNTNINKSHVVVIGEQGEKLGRYSINDAIQLAQEQGLDLVEVNEKNNICRIIDYGKWKYTSAKKAKKNNTTKQVIKEIKFRPNTGDNDLKYRAKQVDKFLKDNCKIKLCIRFRGREIAHMMKTGQDLLERFLGYLTSSHTILGAASLEGNNIILWIGQ